MGDRVVHRAGDALADDLGEAQWDFIYIAQLVHHFDEPTNRAFMRREGRPSARSKTTTMTACTFRSCAETRKNS